MICFWLGGRGGGGCHQKKIVPAWGGGQVEKNCMLGGGGGSYSFVVAINQIPPAPPMLIKNERSLIAIREPSQNLE